MNSGRLASEARDKEIRNNAVNARTTNRRVLSDITGDTSLMRFEISGETVTTNRRVLSELTRGPSNLARHASSGREPGGK